MARNRQETKQELQRRLKIEEHHLDILEQEIVNQKQIIETLKARIKLK